jgi:hypothetical protein
LHQRDTTKKDITKTLFFTNNHIRKQTFLRYMGRDEKIFAP